MNSAAEILALIAVEELDRAYSPGAECEAAKDRILAQQAQVRRAYRNAVDTLRITRLYAQPARSIQLDLRLVHLPSLIESAVALTPLRTSRLSIEFAAGQDRAMCDEDMVRAALINIARSGWGGRRAPEELKVRVTRASCEAVISLPCRIPLKDASTDWRHFDILVAENILKAHEGDLVSAASGPPETWLRWPSNLGTTSG
jgi:hypothetical protein